VFEPSGRLATPAPFRLALTQPRGPGLTEQTFGFIIRARHGESSARENPSSPHPGDKRYIRRDEHGRIAESVNLHRSPSHDDPPQGTPFALTPVTS
jgi:hypothetical protein